MTTYTNPYRYAQLLSKGYIASYKKRLCQGYNISNEQTDKILASMKVEQPTYVSLNKKFLRSSKKARELARELDWFIGLQEILPKKIEYFHKHQEDTFRLISQRKHLVISTGTGSGKTESFMYPIISECAKIVENESKQQFFEENEARENTAIFAIVIYPMNALLNDQIKRMQDSIFNYEKNGKKPCGLLTLDYITGENSKDFIGNKGKIPHILFTNIQMLDRILVSPKYRSIKNALKNLQFVVFDEIHTYTGTTATHIRHLVNRLKSQIITPKNVTFIGSSATLATDENDSGLYRTSNKSLAIDQLGRILFDVEGTTLVESTYQGEEEVKNLSKRLAATTTIYDYSWLKNEKVFTNLYDSQKEWFTLIKKLLSLEITRQDERKILYAHQDEITQDLLEKLIDDLKSHPIVQSLYCALYKEPKSILELKDIVKESLTPNSNPLLVLEIFLGAISFFNEKMPSKPVLDFRLYIFIKSLAGSLTICPNCKTYSTTAETFCLRCNNLLYTVYKNDTSKYFANIFQGKISPVSEQDDKNSFVYLFDIRSECKIQFQGDYDKSKIALSKEKNKDLMPATQTICELMINSSNCSLHDNLSKHYKLLAFVDSRKSVTRYKMNLRDYFIENFYLNILKKIPYSQHNIISTFQFFEIELNTFIDTLPFAPLNDKLKYDAALWFSRYLKSFREELLSTSPFIFQKKLSDPLEQLLINLLLEYMCVDLTDILGESHNIVVEPSDEGVIYKDRAKAKKQNVFYLQEGTKINSGKYIAFSLTSLGDIVKKAVSIIDQDYEIFSKTQYVPMIEGTDNRAKEVAHQFSQIVERNPDLFIKKEISYSSSYDATNKEFIFTVNPLYVNLNVNIDELLPIEKCFLEIVGHSADLEKEERKEIEDKYITKSAFDILFSTSTLEMGIDINGLSQVLLIGMPRTPSNFVQRAGRAGRGKDLRYATIVSIGSEFDAHDMYYFDKPKEMLTGHMPTAILNKYSEYALTQHINAYILSKYENLFEDKSKWEANYATYKPKLLEELNRVFNKSNNSEIAEKCKQYVNTELFNALLQANPTESTLNTLYQHQTDDFWLPDYAFPKNQISIYVYNESNKSYEEITREDPQVVTRHYLPNDLTYLSGKIYEVQGEDFEYKQQRMLNSCSGSDFNINVDKVYSHNAVYLKENTSGEYCSHEGHNVKIFYQDKKYTELEQKVSLPKNYKETPFLTLCQYRKLALNHIVVRNNEKKKSKFDKIVCNQIVRDGILISAAPQFQDSVELFVCLFERYIKHELGHSDSEIAFTECFDVKSYPDCSNNLSYIIYDTGNETIKFKLILKNLDKHFEKIINIIESCTCESDYGCYLCTKSYTSKFYAHKITKQKAIEVFSVILNKKKLRLDIGKTLEQVEALLNIEGYKVSLELFTSEDKSLYRKTCEVNTNKSMFELLTSLFGEHVFDKGIKNIRVMGNNHFHKQLLQINAVENGKREFSQFFERCDQNDIKFIK